MPSGAVHVGNIAAMVLTVVLMNVTKPFEPLDLVGRVEAALAADPT